jgi:hypothetical protein
VERGPVSSTQRPPGRELKVAKVKSQIRNEYFFAQSPIVSDSVYKSDLSKLFVLILSWGEGVDMRT